MRSRLNLKQIHYLVGVGFTLGPTRTYVFRVRNGDRQVIHRARTGWGWHAAHVGSSPHQRLGRGSGFACPEATFAHAEIENWGRG